jgi:hypothetical protein
MLLRQLLFTRYTVVRFAVCAMAFVNVDSHDMRSQLSYRPAALLVETFAEVVARTLARSEEPVLRRFRSRPFDSMDRNGCM